MIKRIAGIIKQSVLLTVLLVAVVCSASGDAVGEISSQEPYETLLALGKQYEEKKLYVHALGAYWDSMEANPENSEEAVGLYFKLADTIRSGKPGYGEFDEFDMFDGWKDLYRDFESYWAETGVYVFGVSRLEKGKLDMTTRTATYNTRISIGKTKKYNEILSIVKAGVKQGRKSEWDEIPADFDAAISSKIPSSRDFELVLAIAGTDGRVLVTGAPVSTKKGAVVGCSFADVDRDTIKIIDAGDFEVIPVAISYKGTELPLDYVKWNIKGGVYTDVYAPGFLSLAEALENCVLVDDFYMMSTEVTQIQYYTVTGSNPSKFKGMNRPCETVTWFDAVKFCNWLSERQGFTPCYSVNGSTDTSLWDPRSDDIQWNKNADGWRLPTRDEWLLAAREGSKNQQYEYSGSNDIDEVAWHGGNSAGHTHDVATKKPNALGLYDMTGNVLEWGWDMKKSTYSRLLFGGNWECHVSACSVMSHFSASPTHSSSGYGFRPVRSVK